VASFQEWDFVFLEIGVFLDSGTWGNVLCWSWSWGLGLVCEK